MCEMNDGVVEGMFAAPNGAKSFLLATSFMELNVLLSHGGQLFLADVNSTSVDRNWCVKSFKKIIFYCPTELIEITRQDKRKR